MTYFSLLFLCRYVDDAVGIWSHAWGSDPALGPVILQCAYDWAVDDSRSKPFIRLEFASPFVIDELIGGELAYDADDEGGQSEEGTDDEDHYDASGWEDRRRRTQRLRHRRKKKGKREETEEGRKRKKKGKKASSRSSK